MTHLTFMLLLAWIPNALATEPQIALASRTFVPVPGVDPALSLELAAVPYTPRHVLVQMHELPTPTERADLVAAGLVLHGYLHWNAFFATVTKPLAWGSRPLELVRAMTPILPEDRIAPTLLRELLSPAAADAEHVTLKVLFFPDSRGARDAMVEMLGGRAAPARTAHEALITIARWMLPTLLTVDAVQWIELAAPTELPLVVPFNDESRAALNVNGVQGDGTKTPMRSIADPHRFHGLTGAGVQVGIMDTGVDANHPDFAGRMVRSAGPDNVGHGTHVAGSVGGSGAASASKGGSPLQWRGMAPSYGVVAYYYTTERSTYEDLVAVYGADLTTNSFVQNVDGLYDAQAADLDDYVRGGAGRTIVVDYASGNNQSSPQYGTITGYFSSFTSAKNTISVGAIDSTNDNLTWFSSIGPTFDGRIKPDVMAPGCASGGDGGIKSTWPGGGYAVACGTSMACPAATGVATLLMEALARATVTDLDTNPPRPATIKSLLVQTAADLVRLSPGGGDPINPDTGARTVYHAGPDFATGYGLIDAEAAIEQVLRRRFMEGQVLVQGQQKNRSILVSGNEPLKVTLAWDDLPSTPNESMNVPKLINDLDLELIDPNGVSYLPMVLDPLPHENLDDGISGKDPITPDMVHPAHPGEDHLNNVEQVLVPLPIAGTWTIRVTATTLVASQRYSIAFSHPLAP